MEPSATAAASHARVERAASLSLGGSLEAQIMELEAQKTAAFDADDFELCSKLRARQMALLEQAAPGSGEEIDSVPGHELSSKLQTEVRSVMGEVEELAALRKELEDDLADSQLAARGWAPLGGGSGGGGGSVAGASNARAQMVREVAELEEMKQRLMGGRSLEECGIVDDDLPAMGGWAASSAAASASAAESSHAAVVAKGEAAAASATDTATMMAEMERLNAEMDAELASLSSAVSAAKVQSRQMAGMRDGLLQQFEETRQEVFREEGVVEAKSY